MSLLLTVSTIYEFILAVPGRGDLLRSDRYELTEGIRRVHATVAVADRCARVTPMNFLAHIAPRLKLYLTLEGVHPTCTYNYSKRGLFNLPVIEVTQHGPKCKQGESWMYIATPVGASHANLKPEEHLYVGAQTQDRMFRGDGLEGANYHHAEMRAGNGNDTPLAMLRSGQRIAIHRISAADLASTVKANAALHFLLPLLQQPKSPKKHIGFWFEQYLLFANRKRPANPG